jgi:uncharacterized membrane protein (UPF0127 family)
MAETGYPRSMRKLRLLAVLAPLTLVAPSAPAQHGPVDFDKGDLTIETHAGPKKFTVELATDEPHRAQGLMYRRRMAADAGMLFIYPHEQPMAMWMKDTVLPLDMVFIAADGRIRNIQERAVPNSLAVIPSDGPVKAALELNAGTVERLGIKPGDRVTAKALDE